MQVSSQRLFGTAAMEELLFSLGSPLRLFLSLSHCLVTLCISFDPYTLVQLVLVSHLPHAAVAQSAGTIIPFVCLL